jgi:hypothetical protein
MVLIPFTVYADVTALAIGAVYIGLSVDEPLADKFSSTPGKVIGIINIYAVGIAVPFGPTTVNVSVGPGDHYVILGIELPAVSFSAYRLQLRGAGTVIDKVFGALEPKQYVYIAFNLDRNGNIKIISTGIVPPGGSPIATPGGGGILGTDVTTAVTNMMGPLMGMMIPLMTMSMMINMMMGLVTSVTQIPAASMTQIPAAVIG